MYSECQKCHGISEDTSWCQYCLQDTGQKIDTDELVRLSFQSFVKSWEGLEKALRQVVWIGRRFGDQQPSSAGSRPMDELEKLVELIGLNVEAGRYSVLVSRFFVYICTADLDEAIETLPALKRLSYFKAFRKVVNDTFTGVEAFPECPIAV